MIDLLSTDIDIAFFPHVLQLFLVGLMTNACTQSKQQTPTNTHKHTHKHTHTQHAQAHTHTRTHTNPNIKIQTHTHKAMKTDVTQLQTYIHTH